MKQFEYLIHDRNFKQEYKRDSRGRTYLYDELRELGKQGWELVTAQQGGNWIFKRETGDTPGMEQSHCPPSPDMYYRAGR